MKTPRRGIAGIAAAALTATGLSVLGVSTAPAAHAAPITIDDAVFRWGLSNESNNSAFFGGSNFFAAGKIGNPGAGSQLLKDADQGATWQNGAAAGWSAEAGNVTIEKKQADGSYATATWDGRDTTATGGSLGAPGAATYSDHQIVIENGTGTVDVAAGTAEISWDGDASVIFYGGYTFWYLSDPELTVNADGTGDLTATVSGYGASMDDPTLWTAIAEREVTLADFDDLDVTEDGITGVPEYLGVEVDTPGNAQARTGTSWGSFPQSFVDFQQLTGQTSYWYSSGSGLDAGKVALPFEVQLSQAPAVTVSAQAVPAAGTTEITVSGTGFAPSRSGAPANPAGLSSGGVYVALGRFASTWKPSDSAASGARTVLTQRWALPAVDHALLGNQASSAIVLNADGSFSTTFSVSKDAFDAFTGNPGGNIGIYTYTRKTDLPSFETFTPISFEAVSSTVATSVTKKPTPSAAGTATLTVTPSVEAEATGDVQLVVKRANGTTVTTTSQQLSGNTASVTLPKLAPGRYSLVANYGGDGVVAQSTSTTTLDIAKVAASVKAKWKKKPTARKAGKLTVSVAATGVKPTGKVTVKVRNAKGKVVKTVKGTLKANGTVVVKVPKLAKGKYTLVVTYAGDAQVNGAKTNAKVTAKRR